MGDESHGLCALKASLVENCLPEHTGPLWYWSWQETGGKRHAPLYPQNTFKNAVQLSSESMTVSKTSISQPRKCACWSSNCGRIEKE